MLIRDVTVHVDSVLLIDAPELEAGLPGEVGRLEASCGALNIPSIVGDRSVLFEAVGGALSLIFLELREISFRPAGNEDTGFAAPETAWAGVSMEGLGPSLTFCLPLDVYDVYVLTSDRVESAKDGLSLLKDVRGNSWSVEGREGVSWPRLIVGTNG